MALASQYASCPQLEDKAASPEQQAVRQLTAKYDSCQGLRRRRLSSTDGSEAASSDSGVADLRVSDHERLQIETFFKGLKTQVFVCRSLANLYLGSAAQEDWALAHTGVPVVLLDSGETRSRRRRRIQLLLAERGTCFTLWQDTVDNLSAYRVAGEAFHTLHESRDHRRLAGLSFDCAEAAAELGAHLERLTADFSNISLSVPRRGKKAQRQRGPAPPRPSKAHISQPCCFQHITSVGAADRDRYLSLRSLVAQPAAAKGDSCR
ncbi:uncharacterized protein LOC134531070 isoform X2 [Bacillus rossius redtenbacheri]